MHDSPSYRQVEGPNIASDVSAAGQLFDVDPRGIRSTIDNRDDLELYYETVIDLLSEGVCFFDADQRLILCNRRYADIYRLSYDQVRPGSTLREIAERRFAAGSSVTAAEDYLAQCNAARSYGESKPWNVTLADGRTIQMRSTHFADGSWVATHEDITAVVGGQVVEKQRVPLQTLIDCLPDYLWIKDTEGRFMVANDALARDHGRKAASDIVGLSDFDLHDFDLARTFRARELEIIRDGRPMIDQPEAIIDASGAKRWLSSTKIPLRDNQNKAFALVGVARDITTRTHNITMLEGQLQIFEMAASNASLNEILDHVVHLAESQLSGLFASVQLVDADRKCMVLGAAPSLPPAFSKAISDVAIGPKAASCGSAAHRKESVIVTDIAGSPVWQDCRELADAHGYRSCWSTPVVSHSGAVLATFALYSKTVRKPHESEMAVVDVATRILRVVIELRKQAV